MIHKLLLGCFAIFLLASLSACRAQVNPPVPVPAPLPEAPYPPPNAFAEIDAHALAVSPETSETPEELAAALVEPAADDLEKARALYRWVTENIQYNVEGLYSGNYGNLAPEAVMQGGTAVCDGYSSLFEELASAAGLEVVTIKGYAKGTGYNVGSSLPNLFNHAWNAVKIDGLWHLLDSTWGAGAMDEKGVYVHQFEPFYFLTPPEQFAVTHFPEDPKWQLLGEPLTRKEFESSPYLKPEFFNLGLSLESHPVGRIETLGPLLSIRIEAEEEVLFLARLRTRREKFDPDRIHIQRDGEKVTLHVLFPRADAYTLRIFAAPGPWSNSYEWAMDYRIKSYSGDSTVSAEEYLNLNGE